MADLRNERGDTLSANDLLLLCPARRAFDLGVLVLAELSQRIPV